MQVKRNTTALGGSSGSKKKQSGNLLTKFADMVSLPQQMEQAANLQMYGNESNKKLGEVLDTRNEQKIANAKNEISYVAERAAVGAADKLEGLVNAVGYAGQAYNRTQNLQNSQDVAMWGAVTGSDTQKSLSRRLEQTALKSAQEGLKDTVTFGDDLRANVERRHANSNISKMGRVAADVSEAAGGLLPSVAVNLIAPGSGMAANAVNAISAAGNAVQEAKKSGADDLRATGYGLATGGIEFATEKVVDGLSGLFGRGALDDIIEKSVEKYLTNQTAKRVVTAAGSAFGEGAEEFISEIGGRLANEWLINTDDRSFRETLKDGLYSGLIGMLLSGGAQAGGSIVNAARTNTSTPVPATSQADYTPYLEQLKQAQRDRKVRELQDAYQKFLESEQQHGLKVGQGELPDKIKADFDIGHSVGAKAKNYEVVDKATGEIYSFVEGSRIQNAEVFAGAGVRKPLKAEVSAGLASEYGVPTQEWQHAKGFAELTLDGEDSRRAEVHWFQAKGVGKVKFKVKRWMDE